MLMENPKNGPLRSALGFNQVDETLGSFDPDNSNMPARLTPVEDRYRLKWQI